MKIRKGNKQTILSVLRNYVRDHYHYFTSKDEVIRAEARVCFWFFADDLLFDAGYQGEECKIKASEALQHFFKMLRKRDPSVKFTGELGMCNYDYCEVFYK